MYKEIKLNDSDHFQLLFDYKIKKEKGTANTSQMLIELTSTISKEELHLYLLANPHFVELINTSLIRPFFGKSRIRIGEGKNFEFEEYSVERIDPHEVYQNDDIGSEPLKVILYQVGEASSILLQFNHVYIDNNGVKNLLRSFNGEVFEFLRSKQSNRVSFVKRLRTTLQLARRMMYKWHEPKAFLHSTSSDRIDKDYMFHTFSDEETTFIKSKVKRSHLIESISSVTLATCCLALKEVLINRNEKLKEFVFQQPFDMTPRKETPYIQGNRISFIYYRLQPEQVTNLTEIQDELNKQTREQIKEQVPRKFLELESVLRLVGLRLHLWMISLPAKGKMTSFAYTFIDEAKVIETFAGREIWDIVNIPPVMRNPPVTFGFAYFNSRLRAEICYDRNSLSQDEAELLFNSIKNQLMA